MSINLKRTNHGLEGSFVLVSDVDLIHNEEILSGLGFSGLRKIRSESFESVINPPDGTVYIGKNKNSLVVCAQDLPMQNISAADTLTTSEEFLSDRFPDSEIGTVILHSVVDLWGFSLVRNAAKIRCFGGTADDGIFVDEGNPLPEEIAFPDGELTNEENDDFDGEGLTFAFCSRFFGTPLDAAEDSFFDTKLDGYSFAHETSELKLPTFTPQKKSRWPFYIAVVVVVLIWQVVKRKYFS